MAGGSNWSLQLLIYPGICKLHVFTNPFQQLFYPLQSLKFYARIQSELNSTPLLLNTGITYDICSKSWALILELILDFLLNSN